MTSSEKPKISALVVAHNEEDQLADCLERLAFADELVVVLDKCTDGSDTIAALFTNNIVEGSWDIEGERRNTGLEACNGDWIIEVDADERVSPELAAEIREAVETEEYNSKELMKPTKIYVNEIEKLKLELNGKIKGFAHITGGGIIGNIKRVLGDGQNIKITNEWKIPNVFHWIYKKSDMTKEEMFHTYNCGIGMAIIVDKNVNRRRLVSEYQLIPMGKVIESEKEVIQYDKFFN